MLFTRCNLIGCPGISGQQGSDESKRIRDLASKDEANHSKGFNSLQYLEGRIVANLNYFLVH